MLTVAIKEFAYKVCILLFQRAYIPIKASLIRKKSKIKVAFVLSDISKWKTEPLYKAMKEHKRFEPYILVTEFIPYKDRAFLLSQLIAYLKDHKYDYSIIKENQVIADLIKPDIIFYQQQYDGSIRRNLKYSKNLKSLFCFAPYGINTLDVSYIYNKRFYDLAWQIYTVNDLEIKGISKYMIFKGRNCLPTGVPLSDALMSPVTSWIDPWKKQDSKKIRIIWAPHYSMPDSRSHFFFSTFLRYFDYMLSVADKYKDQIQIVFKPHPWLRSKLNEIWGADRTELYYSTWANGENTQLVTGDYISLFKYSDAMIHDCGSFTVEYLYTRKPVMYLVGDDYHADQLIEFGKKAYALHYKGRSEEDIDRFISNVIDGKDEMAEERTSFFNKYLLPPGNKSASNNIIDAILGEW